LSSSKIHLRCVKIDWFRRSATSALPPSASADYGGWRVGSWNP